MFPGDRDIPGEGLRREVQILSSERDAENRSCAVLCAALVALKTPDVGNNGCCGTLGFCLRSMAVHRLNRLLRQDRSSIAHGVFLAALLQVSVHLCVIGECFRVDRVAWQSGTLKCLILKGSYVCSSYFDFSYVLMKMTILSPWQRIPKYQLALFFRAVFICSLM